MKKIMTIFAAVLFSTLLLKTSMDSLQLFRQKNAKDNFTKLMFESSGSFKWDTILNPKNWLRIKGKIHGYDGSDNSEIYEIKGAPEYRLIHYSSQGEIGGQYDYYLLKDRLLVLSFGSKYALDEFKYPDEFEDVISFKFLTYFGEGLNSKNAEYDKSLQKSIAISNFVNDVIDEDKLWRLIR
jgi:hypothetical protein